MMESVPMHLSKLTDLLTDHSTNSKRMRLLLLLLTVSATENSLQLLKVQDNPSPGGEFLTCGTFTNVLFGGELS
jgi:hypothetical protein